MQMLLFKNNGEATFALRIESIVSLRSGEKGRLYINLVNGEEIMVDESMEKLLKALQAGTDGPIVIEAGK